MINNFTGAYWFLSNFYAAPFTYDGVTYSTVEHAYQAAKALDPDERAMIQAADTPGAAKRLGRQVTLRSDWEQVKVGIMTQLVRQKFLEHPSLAEALLATGNEELVEGNTWGDRFWGAVFDHRQQRWEGQNQLGKILMELRQELRTTGAR